MANDTPEPPGFHDPDAYQALWDAMSWQERLSIITGTFAAARWFGVEAIPTLTLCRLHGHPGLWGETKATFKSIGGSPFDLEKEVDKAVRLYQRSLGETAASPTAVPSQLPPRHPVPPTGCPPLPAWAQCQAPTAHASAWLDAYVAHSRRWSPRGMASAHQAVGLWILSTVAARRIVCQDGSKEVIPALSMAMVAPSTIYAKSTTVHIGRDLLARAGLKCLLAADRTTPQALLRSMAGAVPPRYGKDSADKQEHTRARLAFAGQRGTYMEEWGGMLSQMNRTESAMAAFHSLLRMLDDGEKTFENDTIARGYEDLNYPYLAVLASATPHDLAPFVGEGSKWWHDGFWARFAFLTPAADEQPSMAHPPRGGYVVPGTLIIPLADWHRRLGIPTVQMVEDLDPRGKPTGGWGAEVSALPQQHLHIDPEVSERYEAYNDGLGALLIRGDVPNDFNASYGRFHAKALRIALLLASFAGEASLTLHHWSAAQQITEQWRRNLHQLYTSLGESQTLSREEETEGKVLRYLCKAGQATAREIAMYCHVKDSGLLHKTLVALERTEQIVVEKQGRTTRYGLLPSDADEDMPTTLDEIDHLSAYLQTTHTQEEDIHIREEAPGDIDPLVDDDGPPC